MGKAVWIPWFRIKQNEEGIFIARPVRQNPYIGLKDDGHYRTQGKQEADLALPKPGLVQIDRHEAVQYGSA